MGVYRKNTPPHRVRIPVLPYVKKVLLHEYGPEPISVMGYSILGKYLSAFPLDFPNEEHDEKSYGEEVTFHISSNLYPHFKKYETLFQAGYYFEKVVQRMLLAHIEAQHRLGGKILDAIEDWYDMYGIEEDDLRMDAVYELWKQYKKKASHACNG